MVESGRQWQYSTYRKVRTIYNHLQEFEKAKDYPLAFNRINRKFLDLFAEFYRERGNNHNTTLKAVNILVWFLNWATYEGYNVFRDYRKFYGILGGAKPTENSKIFLNRDELKLIQSLELADKKLLRTRDLFCLMCYAGLRFSEIQNLKKQDILKDEIVVRTTYKKDRSVRLSPAGVRILKRYENRYFKNDLALPPVSLITFNKHLKVLCEKAGINEMTVSPGSSGKEVYKYRLVTSSVALNTFIADAMEFNIPAEIISGFTGIENSLRYAIIQKEMEKKGMIKPVQFVT